MNRTGCIFAAAALGACHAGADWSFHVGVGGPDGAVVGPDGAIITSGVLVTPSMAHVSLGRSAVFSANVVGSSDMSVTWSVQEGASGGTVDSTGLYTAPMTAGTYHVIATSQALKDSGSATVVVSSVGSCSALPAKGTWDSASIAPVVATAPKTAFDGKSCTVIVDPFDSSTVWLGTGNKGLFKSTDCGATWAHVNTGTNGASLDQSTLWSLVVDPVNQGVIYTVAAYGVGGIWKSTNGGVDWQQTIPANSNVANAVPYNFLGNVSMDPSNPNHLVAASHGKCNDPYPNGCIAETFDGGNTWPNIAQIPTGWGETGGILAINATTWMYGTGEEFQGAYLTTDNGKNWKSVTPGHMGDVVAEFTTQPLERASDGAYYVASLQGAVRSTDGMNWSLAWGMKNFAGADTFNLAVSTKTIYGGAQNTIYSAPIGDFTNWSTMSGTPTLTDNLGFFAYDEAHHILYVSDWAGGLFRYVDE
jgi:hypothetical protein